jgi:anaerobic selenocysteine-containing dehydrogenase
MTAEDAHARDVVDGDLVEVRSRRGRIVAPVRLTAIAAGTVFAPFHYGYWDAPEDAEHRHPTAANELTVTEWDPTSKQPLFKTGAVRVSKYGGEQ